MRVLATTLQRLSVQLSRAAHALERTLPALVPAEEIIRLVQAHYSAVYGTELDASETLPVPAELAVWERLVLDRFVPGAGLVLVMGAGWGRETLAIARRGGTVLGLDANFDAVRKGARLARKMNASAAFQQGNFLAPPYKAASFDCVLLGGTMYSAIPGSARRQAWLAETLPLVRPEGLVIVSFLSRLLPVSRLRAWANRLNGTLMHLPGANPDYQAGDISYEFHFLHEFQDEGELRGEFTRAGATVLELDWNLGYAVMRAAARRH